MEPMIETEKTKPILIVGVGMRVGRFIPAGASMVGG